MAKADVNTRPVRPTTAEPTFGHLATQAYLTALELGFMDQLADGPATARDLARAAHADRRATIMVLDALAAMGLLDKRGDRYVLARRLRTLLASPGVEAATYFRDSLNHLRYLTADWSHLSKVVRTGRPVRRRGTSKGDDPVLPILARRLFPGNYHASKALRRALPARLRRTGLAILDVAAGSAAWSIPFAEADPTARVTAADFAPVLDVARHFTRACGVGAQYTFKKGDIRRVRFAAGRYDLAILAHICHAEGPSGTARLFRKVHAALVPGGVMVVVEMIPDEGRTGRRTGAFPLLFALNMLVHSDTGGTFTVSEYQAWGRAAGFAGPRRIRADIPAPALLFTKESAHG